MADPFNERAETLTAPCRRHVLLSADVENDIDPRPRAIWCEAAGTIILRDENGVGLPYTMRAGLVLPFRPMRVMAISGGTFYGLS